MNGSTAYHLALTRENLKGARCAFLPGAPERVPLLARAFDKDSLQIAWNREFRTWAGIMENETVIVTSTGIGGPSATIAIEELAQLGIRVFVRVGTSGAIQPTIKVGDVVITTGSVRLEGSSRHYAPLEYPAVADYHVLHALMEAAGEIGPREAFDFHVGITVSGDTFYPGQERYDTYSGYVIRRFQGTLEEWRHLHALNYEMESAAIFTACAALGLRGGCVAGIVVNRAISETPAHKAGNAEQHAIAVAVEGMRRLIRRDP